VRINPQSFFNFCANHAPLLRALSVHGGEFSEAEAMRVIRANPGVGEELAETAWRRLRELQILIPTEPGSDLFFMAEPVARLLNYLFNEANPATPEIIRGYVASLEAANGQLTRALGDEDVQRVSLAFEEISQTLRRIHADLNETQNAILAEVTRYKTERARVSVREKYRRIVHWMERYVEPMIEVVRADGPLRSAFEETERLLHRAREEALLNDHPALTRNLRFLRLVSAYGLRVFTQCRKEIQPLYESLRRSSFIAEGASLALEQLQAAGLLRWGDEYLVGVASWRYQNVPSDVAIVATLRRVIEHPPESPPVLELTAEEETPDALVRLIWLESLPNRVTNNLPIQDLLGWLVETFSGRDISDVLAGFSALVFHSGFRVTFTDRELRTYFIAGEEITASPVQLTST
jgi:hypothetical protein